MSLNRKPSHFHKSFALSAILVVGLLNLAPDSGLTQENSADSVKSSQPEKPPVVSMRKPPTNELTHYQSDEVFFRRDKSWGFELDLDGFFNLSNRVSGMTIVGYGVREDSIGLTLAHLYVHSLGAGDTLPTAKYYLNRMTDSMKTDPKIVQGTLSMGQGFGFETVEHDKVEVWPQPDPNNPGQMFDSTLTRRHLNAITIYRGSWIELHLSKTEYQPADSAVFSKILNTFKITEDIKPALPKPVKIKSATKQ